MLMSAYDRAVDHRILVVGISGEMLENALPHAGLGPSAETAMHRHTITEALRQIAPGQTRTEPVKHGLDEQPVVPRGDANMPLTSGQQVLDTLPLIVPKAVASHWSAPSWLTRYESKFPPRRNPLNDDTP